MHNTQSDSGWSTAKQRALSGMEKRLRDGRRLGPANAEEYLQLADEYRQLVHRLEDTFEFAVKLFHQRHTPPPRRASRTPKTKDRKALWSERTEVLKLMPSHFDVLSDAAWAAILRDKGRRLLSDICRFLEAWRTYLDGSYDPDATWRRLPRSERMAAWANSPDRTVRDRWKCMTDAERRTACQSSPTSASDLPEAARTSWDVEAMQLLVTTLREKAPKFVTQVREELQKSELVKQDGARAITPPAKAKSIGRIQQPPAMVEEKPKKTGENRWFDCSPSESDIDSHRRFTLGPVECQMNEAVALLDKKNPSTTKKYNGVLKYYVQKMGGQQFDVWFADEPRMRTFQDRLGELRKKKAAEKAAKKSKNV